jgi:hypothetical protein
LQHSASAQPLWQPVVVTAAEAVVVTAAEAVVVTAAVAGVAAGAAGVAVRERALPQCPEVARDL